MQKVKRAFKKAMTIAVEGCCHGELKKIYSELGRLEQNEGTKVDLLIICGDFQAVRNEYDLKCLACPPKYRQMGDFHLYYSGKEKAPVTTIFIGGNHEASNHLFDLYHGGWVCPNIYFLGYSGVVNFGGLRIGGISGIHNAQHYDLGYYERDPYDHASMRSIYHYRRLEIQKLAQLVTEPLDIFISHEWPTGIYNYGDKRRLLSIKPYFKNEVDRNELGAKPLEDLLFKIKPSWWFAAHMHVHFEAQVPHPGESGKPGSATQFVALDKCLPRRKFLQIFDIEPKVKLSKVLRYDKEWLGIVKAAEPFMSMQKKTMLLPESFKAEPLTIDDNQLIISTEFRPSVKEPSNPQTDRLCQLLGIPTIAEKKGQAQRLQENPDEIKLEF